MLETFHLFVRVLGLLSYARWVSAVVIDYREDKNVDTGQFELAYKQRMPSCQPYLGAALSLQGTRITTCGKKANLNNQESKVSLVSKSPMVGIKRKSKNYK